MFVVEANLNGTETKQKRRQIRIFEEKKTKEKVRKFFYQKNPPLPTRDDSLLTEDSLSEYKGEELKRVLKIIFTIESQLYNKVTNNLNVL